MLLAVLRKIRDMVTAGAVVVGLEPIDSPSLADDQAEFKTIARNLWGATTGKGKVFGNGTIAEALASLKVAADFIHEAAVGHRTRFRTPQGHLWGIYWVSHRNDRGEDVEATFRVQGMATSSPTRQRSTRIHRSSSTAPICRCCPRG
jgi:hypothetical protein